MTEKLITTEIVNSLKAHGWAYKIPDAPSRFAPEKPCDILASINGNIVAIEVKLIKKWQSFGMRAMRPSQIKHLTLIKKSGGMAFVFLNLRMKGVNKLFIFEWESFRMRALPFSIKDLQARPAFPGAKKTFDLKEFCQVVSL